MKDFIIFALIIFLFMLHNRQEREIERLIDFDLKVVKTQSKIMDYLLKEER